MDSWQKLFRVMGTSCQLIGPVCSKICRTMQAVWARMLIHHPAANVEDRDSLLPINNVRQGPHEPSDRLFKAGGGGGGGRYVQQA